MLKDQPGWAGLAIGSVKGVWALDEDEQLQLVKKQAVTKLTNPTDTASEPVVKKLTNPTDPASEPVVKKLMKPRRIRRVSRWCVGWVWCARRFRWRGADARPSTSRTR